MSVKAPLSTKSQSKKKLTVVEDSEKVMMKKEIEDLKEKMAVQQEMFEMKKNLLELQEEVRRKNKDLE